MDSALVEAILVVSLMSLSLFAATMYSITIRMYEEMMDKAMRIRVKAAVTREIYHGISIVLNDNIDTYESTIYFDELVGVRGDGEDLVITYKGVDDRISLSWLKDDPRINSLSIQGGRAAYRFTITITLDRDTGALTIEITTPT